MPAGAGTSPALRISPTRRQRKPRQPDLYLRESISRSQKLSSRGARASDGRKWATAQKSRREPLMRHARWLALAVLMGAMGLVAGQTTTKTAKAKDNKEETIPQRIARDTKLNEKDADKFFN